MIFINFKIYREAWGEKGVELAKICERVGLKTGVKIIPVVSALDYGLIRNSIKGEIFLQHTDWQKDGAHNGAISMEQAQTAGVAGSLVNHSEKKLKLGTIKKTVAGKPEGFKLLTICQNINQITKWGSELKTDYLAWEPKELIGNPEVSVMDKYEEQVKKLVTGVKVPLIIGAGIHRGEDVRRAIAAGAAGVLVASDVVKAGDPEKELTELAEAF
jgi:triosephosphate isomerase